MKTTTHYFVYVGHGTQTKNKLQEEFNDYLKALSGTLIDEPFFDELKAAIVKKSEELNQKHTRCTPLKVGFSELYTKDGFMITGFYFLIFQILSARHTSPFYYGSN